MARKVVAGFAAAVRGGTPAAADPTAGSQLGSGAAAVQDLTTGLEDLLGDGTSREVPGLADHPGGMAEFAAPEDRDKVAAAEAAAANGSLSAPVAGGGPLDLGGASPEPAAGDAAAPAGTGKSSRSFDDILADLK